jgi:hypothetical protein
MDITKLCYNRERWFQYSKQKWWLQLQLTGMVIKDGNLNKRTLHKPVLTTASQLDSQKHLPPEVTTNSFES